jgi:transcriptional regulator with XRE-family HTH domain
MPDNLSTLQGKFGKNLRDMRKLRGYSQLELAIKCELEKTAISRIENGRTNITLRTIEILANALNVPCKELFDFDTSYRQ